MWLEPCIWLDSCPSKQACNQTRYSLDFTTSGWTDISNVPSKAKLRIAFTNPIVEYNTDSISYDFQSLIGEVGGTLGLTIGLSFFSFVEWLTEIFTFFAVRIQKL